MSYWAQFSTSEILSMHGIELDECQDTDYDLDSESNNESDACPKCSGCGCNYCLMVIW